MKLLWQPPSFLAAQGGEVELQVVASGGVLAYQWFHGASGDISHPVAGANGPQFTAGVPSLGMTLRQRKNADASCSYESSGDLMSWSLYQDHWEILDGDVEGDGSTELIRVILPLDAGGQGFLRVKIIDP